MSGLPILDVVIGMAFVYLLLALVCTTVMEWIAQIRNLRGNLLERSTRRLLDEAGRGAVADAYLQHPLIRSLRDGSRQPSYVSGQTFAKALRDVLSQDPSKASATLKQSFKALAPTDVLPSEQSLADWYDSVMDRVSGTYKRQTRTIILWMAVAVTIVLNADSISLTRNLWQNPTLRSYLVESAKTRLEQGPPLETVEYTDPTTPTPTAPIASDSTRSPDRLLVEEQDLLGSLFGWRTERISFDTDRARWGPFQGSAIWMLLHFLGWAITALAVSLGAPFWFDTLSRLVRSTGNPASKTAAENA